MDQLLLSLWINITSNIIYDFLKKKFSENSFLWKDVLKDKLSSFLNIQNSNIVAETIIEFLAKNGDIKIEWTNIYANNSVSMFSSKDTNFVFGNNSVSSTKKTKISAGSNMYIQGQGWAWIKQNGDGSISFFA